MVDSGSSDRLAEAKEVFSAIAEHEKVKGKPLLIFANKQDIDEAIDDDAVAQHLDLDALLGGNRVNASVVRSVAGEPLYEGHALCKEIFLLEP